MCSSPNWELIDSRKLGELPAYWRYADEIFLLVDQNVHIETLVDLLHQVQSSRSFTSEEEWENSFHFLDVKIPKKMDRKLIRRLYRRLTWTAQYIHFAGSVLLKCNREPAPSLASCVQDICSKEILKGELGEIGPTSSNNGCAERCILQNVQEVFMMDKRKELHVQLSFKWDSKCWIVVRRL